MTEAGPQQPRDDPGARDPHGDRPPRRPENDRINRALRRKAERKIAARGRQERSVWFGLGMLGIVGWSVAIPTLAGIALGVWLDNKLDDQISWTLTLLLVGVALGCLNAWYWVKRESRDRHE